MKNTSDLFPNSPVIPAAAKRNAGIHFPRPDSRRPGNNWTKETTQLKRIGMMGAVIAAFILTIIVAIPSVLCAQAQSPPAGGEVLTRVMWVVLAGWAGIGVYIFFIDRKVSRLEKKGRHD